MEKGERNIDKQDGQDNLILCMNGLSFASDDAPPELVEEENVSEESS